MILIYVSVNNDKEEIIPIVEFALFIRFYDNFLSRILL